MIARPALPHALAKRLAKLLAVRQRRTLAYLRAEKLIRDADPFALTRAERLELEAIGRELVRFGLAQAMRQSPVFAGAIPPGQQPLFSSAYRSWVSDTEAQLVGLSATQVQQVRAVVLQGQATNTPTADLAKLIQERINVAGSHADYLATQAANTLAARSLEARHEAAGVTEFIWRTNRDRIVRPEHRARDGQKYSYANPPGGELPGTPPRCRCYAEPVIPGYLSGAETTFRPFDPRSQSTQIGPDPLGWLAAA